MQTLDTDKNNSDTDYKKNNSEHGIPQHVIFGLWWLFRMYKMFSWQNYVCICVCVLYILTGIARSHL